MPDAALKAKKAPQAESFPKDHRPGWFKSLVLGERF
jgi:mannose-1-phosphate guanylyltransferase/mannose-6-phosphate isomerase